MAEQRVGDHKNPFEPDARRRIGTLRIEGDQICTKYPKIKKGAENCFGISKTAKGYKTTHGATLWP
ncbi:MAG: hypothetical protein E5X67_36385 [Mesorhizobium sp.]|nr:MAG: hypothetical protein E5X67_36385 [Mesorhizobium sp.]